MKSEKFETVSCDCQSCVSMCCNFPCMGSVEEVEKILEAGFGAKLMLYEFWDAYSAKYVTALMPANEKHNRQLIFGTYFKSGRCSLLSEENKCLLHEAKLKPLEGRFADCKNGSSRNLTQQQYDQQYREMKAMLNNDWSSKKGKALITRWKSEFYKKEVTAWSNAVETADLLF